MKHLALAGLLALSAMSPAAAHVVADARSSTDGVTVLDGFARATLPGAPVAGAYVTLENAGSDDDRLIGVSSPAAGRMEIHDMIMTGDTMKMIPLPDGLPIPAGGSAVLEPSGKHLMLMELKGPLVEGDTVEVTLTFEHAAPITVELPVAAVNASSHGH